MEALTLHDCTTELTPEFIERDATERVNGMTDHQPPKLDTLADVIAWVRHHDATIAAWWDEQRRFNKGTDTKTFQCQSFMQNEIREIRKDIQAMRRLIYIAMGGALVLCSVASVVLAWFFQNGNASGLH